jgi:hypothetical protein
MAREAAMEQHISTVLQISRHLMDENRYQPKGLEESWLSLSTQPMACLLASK